MLPSEFEEGGDHLVREHFLQLGIVKGSSSLVCQLE